MTASRSPVLAYTEANFWHRVSLHTQGEDIFSLLSKYSWRDLFKSKNNCVPLIQIMNMQCSHLQKTMWTPSLFLSRFLSIIPLWKTKQEILLLKAEQQHKTSEAGTEVSWHNPHWVSRSGKLLLHLCQSFSIFLILLGFFSHREALSRNYACFRLVHMK